MLLDKDRYSYTIEGNILDQIKVAELLAEIGPYYLHVLLKTLFSTDNFEGGVLKLPGANNDGYLITNLYHLIKVDAGVNLDISGQRSIVAIPDSPEHSGTSIGEIDDVFAIDDVANIPMLDGFVAKHAEYVRNFNGSNLTIYHEMLANDPVEYAKYADSVSYIYPTCNLVDNTNYQELISLYTQLYGYEHGWYSDSTSSSLIPNNSKESLL